MKKLGLLVMPLMAVSLLASCAQKTKTYHIKFTNGNELVEEKDYKEDESIVAPKDPTPYEKDHKVYTFDSWVDGDTKYESGLKATKDYNFDAKFTSEDIIYTVEFKDKGELVKRVTGKFDDPIEAPTDPAGYDDDTDFYHYNFDGWYDGKTEFEKDVTTITGNQTFTSKYTKGNPVTYYATFHAKEKDETVEFNVENTTQTTPETGDTPSTGHTLYWLIGSDQVKPGEEYDFIEYLGSAAEVNYSSIANPHTVTLKISGQDDVVIDSAYGEKVLSEDVPQTKDYYEKIEDDDHYYHHFTGRWTKTDGGTDYVTNTDTLGDADMTIYAEFTKDETDPIKYAIKFLNDDGETVLETKTIYCPETLSITAPKITEISGYTSKWVSNTYIFDSEATIEFADEGEGKLPIDNYNFVLTPTAIEYTIDYVLYGGSWPSGETHPTTYKVDEKITLVAPEQEGFVFKGWYLAPYEVNPLGGNGWEPGDRIGNVMLYADWHVKDKTLDDYTWKQISDISDDDYKANKYFDIGDTKTISMGGNEYSVRIIDYNRDPLVGVSKKAGITFDFADTINHLTQWGSNPRRFTESALYNCLKEEGGIYTMIDAVTDGSGKLMNYIKTVKKSYRYVPLSEYEFTNGEYVTKLFPLSMDEMGYNDSYNFYKINSQERRKKSSDYWLRSPSEDRLNPDNAWSCKSGGLITFAKISSELNVAPGFCI